MLYFTDIETDNSGDIVIENSEIKTDTDGYSNCIKVGQNRLQARYDDFSLNDISAGLERFIYQEMNLAKYNIEYNIRNSLGKGNLFSQSDFDIIFPTIDKTLLPFIKINSTTVKNNGFRVIIDSLNQQSYI